MMQAADVNGDGLIDYGEFVTAAADINKIISEPNIQAVFNIFDTDGDGSITASELQAAFGASCTVGYEKSSRAFWDQIMRDVDANHDGVISYEEFRDVMFAASLKNTRQVKQANT